MSSIFDFCFRFVGAERSAGRGLATTRSGKVGEISPCICPVESHRRKIFPCLIAAFHPDKNARSLDKPKGLWSRQVEISLSITPKFSEAILVSIPRCAARSHPMEPFSAAHAMLPEIQSSFQSHHTYSPANYARDVRDGM